MDCAAHYGRLIKRAQTRSIDGYTERHHITPRCLGGTDDPTNIVRLKRTALTMDYSYMQTPAFKAARSAGLKLWWANRRAQQAGG